VKFTSAQVVNQIFLFFFLLAGCFALTGTATAQNNYYVNASTGSDSNDGSQARPWKTIQKADSALSLGSGGTIVHVAPGTYGGNITTSRSGTSSARITFLSDTSYGAKIVNGSWQINGSYSEVNGFDITNPNCDGCYFVNIGQNGTTTTGVRLQFNNMHDASTNVPTGSCGSRAGGVNTVNGPPKDVLINGNIIRHVGSNTSSGGRSCMHAIYDEAIGSVITNNIISGSTGAGIKSDMVTSGQCAPRVISNNTIFNNSGGLNLTGASDAGIQCAWDNNTISNNIIVNNGVAGVFAWGGINYYHVTGTHNLVTNNVVYGNVPWNYAHHDVACTGGTPISGSDANGTAGGCPSTNPKTDPSISDTFVNFQTDNYTAPASNYNASNYQIRAGSSAIGNGSTSCAPSGINPCVPDADFIGVARLSSGLDIGAFEQGSGSEVANAPAAPTGLTATVQ
jgi:hypothetical protein